MAIFLFFIILPKTLFPGNPKWSLVRVKAQKPMWSSSIPFATVAVTMLAVTHSIMVITMGYILS